MTETDDEMAWQSIEMPGGRRLAFIESGAPAGRAVIHFHGSPSSWLERWPDDAVLAELGVRLVTFDRPGYGRSEPMPGRTLLDCAADVGRLADHLGLGTFALSGVSAGGPFVLATAWAHRDRVAGAAITGDLGPPDRPGALEGMSAANAEEFQIARDHPERLERLLQNFDLSAAMSEEEMGVFGSIPGLAEMLMESVSEAMHQGWQGALADDLAFVRPWGIALEEITVPLFLWHGDRDRLVPLHHSEFVAEHVPSAQLHRCTGEGHVAMFAHQQEALEALIAGWATRGS